MWSTEQGKGCVYMNESHSVAGAEVLGRQLGLYLWGHPGRVTGLLLQAGPTLAPCTAPSSSQSTGGGESGCMSPHLIQEESHSCTLRTSRTVNPTTVSEDKWRVPWKAISNTAIGTPKVYHSDRWGLLVKLADGNFRWKMRCFCYKLFLY